MACLELGIMRHDINHPERSQQLIDWAMAHGVNHFESCWFYMNFECENFLYSLLKKYPRKDYFICGKMPIHNIVKNNDFKEIFNTQLKRVDGHYFDTYLLQALDERTIIDLYENQIIDFFLKEKRKGTIKRFGLSIQCRPEIFKQLLELKCWDVVQMPLNYFDYYLCRYDENYHLAVEYGIPIIAQAPVKGGLLTKSTEFNPALFKNKSLSQAAFDFLASLENIEMILCGNSSLATFQNTFEAFSRSEKINDFTEYLTAIETYRTNHVISCLECGRCDLNCKKGLPISAYIRLYNLALYDKTYFNAFDILKSAPDEPNHLCYYQGCQDCIEACPLSNDIPNLFFNRIFELRT